MEEYIGVNEIMQILGVKETKAYNIISMLNDEMKKKGYLTVRGRVSRKYFYERIYI